MRTYKSKKYGRRHINIDKSINKKDIEVVEEKKRIMHNSSDCAIKDFIEHTPIQSVCIEKKFVIPGDNIGAIEEYIAGTGTYSHKGKIYSSNTGFVNIKELSKTIEVVPVTNTPYILKEGDVFVGGIVNMRDSMALISISVIKGRAEQEMTLFGLGALHISNVRNNFVENIYNEFLHFDIVKAKILTLEKMQLSTKDDALGVIHANCSNCRIVLKKERDKLKCPECGKIEIRKISSDYGTGIL